MYYDKNKTLEFEYSENTLSNFGRLYFFKIFDQIF